MNEVGPLCAFVGTNDSTDQKATIELTNHLGQKIEVIYEQPSSALRHQQGNSGRALMDNAMQGVHTERIVVYVPLGRQKQLSLLETKYTYSRWYQYDTDASISVGSINLYSNLLPGNKGFYNFSASNVTYTAPNSMPSGSNVATDVMAEIACDLSYYKDYSFNNYNQLNVEPTLSQRVIYEIRPAQQMVNKLSSCTNSNGSITGNYLENYEMIAPIGATLRFGPEFEYTGSNNNYYKDNNTLLTNAVWYKNGQVISVSPDNNRVISVSHNTAEKVVYTLVLGDKGIAKFTVDFQDINVIGPKANGVINDSVLIHDYTYVTGLNFNNNPNIPLQWDESGYGFFYWEWLNNTSKRSYGGVYWGEYGFMNVTDHTHNFLQQGVYDRTYYKTNGADKSGRFLYVDASSKPGVVASLRFNEGNLCPGTHMYVSAWVNNLGVGTNPNLNFVIVGIDAEGHEENIAIYNTGDLSHASGHRGVWKQVFFEVMMPEKEFADYRLRIVNNAQNANGNDFAIDDIAIYMQKPALMVYQAGVACASNDAEEVDEVIMVRMDSEGFDFGSHWNMKTIYYQFQDSEGNPIALSYEGTTNKTYGQFTLANKGVTPFYTVYNPTNGKTGLELYAEERNLYLENKGDNPGNLFITVEADEKGELKDIYYLLHENDGEFISGNSYQCVIALDPATFGNGQENCGMLSSFTMQPKARLVINGELAPSLDASDLCANQINTIGMRLYGANGDLNQIFSGSCRYDWLSGNVSDYDENGIYNDFDYKTIISAIQTLREVYPLIADINSVEAKDLFSQSQLELLQELVSRGMLELCKEEIERRLMPGETNFTVIPVAQSAQTEDGKPIQVCNRPFVITLNVGKADRSFSIGIGSEKGVPAEVITSPRILRYSAQELNSQTLQVPVFNMIGVTLSDLQDGEKCQVFLLGSTSDKSAPL